MECRRSLAGQRECARAGHRSRLAGAHCSRLGARLFLRRLGQLLTVRLARSGSSNPRPLCAVGTSIAAIRPGVADCRLWACRLSSRGSAPWQPVPQCRRRTPRKPVPDSRGYRTRGQGLADPLTAKPSARRLRRAARRRAGTVPAPAESRPGRCEPRPERRLRVRELELAAMVPVQPPLSRARVAVPVRAVSLPRSNRLWPALVPLPLARAGASLGVSARRRRPRDARRRKRARRNSFLYSSRLGSWNRQLNWLRRRRDDGRQNLLTRRGRGRSGLRYRNGPDGRRV